MGVELLAWAVLVGWLISRAMWSKSNTGIALCLVAGLAFVGYGGAVAIRVLAWKVSPRWRAVLGVLLLALVAAPLGWGLWLLW